MTAATEDKAALRLKGAPIQEAGERRDVYAQITIFAIDYGPVAVKRAFAFVLMF
ncbi:hypothetical protein X759_28220 [Mesorhizobium sp. LSHC420B00]|nr:hypothetical protein X759_28220 [Mesorhizobium sp. LSHC420B00]